MNGYVDFVAQDRRLVILRILAGVAERRVNQYVLRSALKSMGYDELVPTVVNDLNFLNKQGCLLLADLSGDIILATLTDLGDQVARGVTRIAGVAAPTVG